MASDWERKRQRGASVLSDGGNGNDMETDKPDFTTKTLSVFTSRVRGVTVNQSNIGARPFSPLPGLLFPYFRRSIDADLDMVMRVITRHFGYLLDTTPSGVTATVNKLREDLERVIKTEEGLQVVHMFYGIEQALESATTLFLLIKHKRYSGFVLQGHNFTVSTPKGLMMPVNQESLLQEVMSLATHDTALEKICTLLSMIAIEDTHAERPGEEVAVMPSSIGNARQLFREVYIRRRNIDDETRREIDLAALDIAFDEEPEWLEITAGNIEMVASCVLSKDLPDHKLPFFLKDGNITSGSHIVAALAAFGPTAPTFMFPNGKKIVIGTGKDDPVFSMTEVSSVVDGKVTKRMAPKYPVIYIARRSTRVAAEDWVEMSSKGYVLQPPSGLGKKESSAHKILKGESIVEYWSKLQVFSRKNFEDDIVVYPSVGREVNVEADLPKNLFDF